MRRLAGLWAMLAGATACAGASPPSPHGSAPPSAPAEPSAPAWSSPARWDYHPAAPESVRAHARLPDGSCVLVADDGQRWLVTPARPGDAKAASAAAPAGASRPAPPRICSGRAEAADVLAPEELVGIVRRSASAWIYVGASGTLYETGDPLGPFTRALPSPEPLARVSGAGGTVLAATLDGRLVRWEESGGWRPGPNVGARVFDLAFADGRALALAIPEALFTSDDGGLRFARAAAPPIGARRVGLTSSGQLAADGFAGSLAWTPRDHVPFVRSSEPLLVSPTSADLEVGRAASGNAVASGRAAIDGERYLEAVHPDDDADPWLLARGRIDGRLDLRPIAGTAGCGALKLGANGRHVVVVCSRAAGDDVDATVLRSEDGGESFEAATALVTDSIDHVAVAVAQDGAALVTGTCKPAERSGCKPTSPVLVRPDGKKATAMLTAAAQLANAAVAPAFSSDGRSAYVLGLRGKDDRPALFVSHDGGESFAPRPLEPPRSAKPRGDGSDDDDGEPENAFELDDGAVVHPGEDGTVGLRLARSRGAAWVTTDDDGRVIAVAGAPSDAALLGGVGRRVLSVSPEETRPGAGASAWESLDGGSTWTELPTPRALAREVAQGTGTLACGAGGCLVGESVARVGWSGQVETIAEPPPSADSSGRGEPATKTPIVCELSPSSGWTRIDGVENSGRFGLPDENETARGRAVWSVLTRDRATGAISVVAALLPESGDGEARVTTRRLLGPAPRGARVALEIAPQMEGYAAVRVKLPLDANGKLKPGSPMSNLEVAWENFMDGTSGRATVADAGPFEPGDVRSSPGEAEDHLETSLVSVSLKGIFVRPHAPTTPSASMALFIDATGKVDRFEYPPWPAASQDGRKAEIHGDAAIAEGTLIGVARVVGGPEEPRTVLLGRPPPRGGGSHAWELTATSVAPPATGGLVVADEWTYVGAALGFTTLVADARRERAWGFYHPFKGDGTFGAAVPVPTQLDLADRPRACSAAERAATARMEAPLFQGGQLLFVGTRHPVLVIDGASAAPPAAAPKGGRGARSPRGASATRFDAGLAPATADAQLLLTAGAVLHGTPSSPCLAAWQATGASRAPFSAIVPADLAHAWLFRPATAEPSPRSIPPARAPKPGKGAPPPPPERPRGPSIEVRPMACHFDPSAKVPDVAWSEPGAVRTLP
jgi:hypothetical protein